MSNREDLLKAEIPFHYSFLSIVQQMTGCFFKEKRNEEKIASVKLILNQTS